jgi:hypothetical protein
VEVTIDIDAKKLLAAFAAAPDKTRQEMALAMKMAVRDVAESARRNHRFTSRGGQLERSIEGKLESSEPLIGSVSAGGDGAGYARAIHDGSGLWGPKRERYPIVPVHRKALRWVGGNRFMFAKKVMHPGVKPDPFLTNAVSTEIPNIQKLFGNAIEKALNGGGTDVVL